MVITYHKFANPENIKYNIEKHAKEKMLYVQYVSMHYKRLPVGIYVNLVRWDLSAVSKVNKKVVLNV